MKGSRVFRALNLTRGETLAERVVIADSFWSRFRGLLGRPGFPSGTGLLLVPACGVHTFFLRFPIDAALLSPAGVILKIASPLPPNRLGPLVWGARYLLELPAGTLRKTGSREGDRVRFIPLG